MAAACSSSDALARPVARRLLPDCADCCIAGPVQQPRSRDKSAGSRPTGERFERSIGRVLRLRATAVGRLLAGTSQAIGTRRPAACQRAADQLFTPEYERCFSCRRTFAEARERAFGSPPRPLDAFAEPCSRSGEPQLERACSHDAEHRLPGGQDRHGPASPGKSGASRNLVRLHQHVARLGRPEAKPAPSVLDQIGDPRRWVPSSDLARDQGPRPRRLELHRKTTKKLTEASTRGSPGASASPAQGQQVRPKCPHMVLADAAPPSLGRPKICSVVASSE